MNDPNAWIDSDGASHKLQMIKAFSIDRNKITSIVTLHTIRKTLSDAIEVGVNSQYK